MGRIVEAILNLSGPTAYGLVGLLAFGEAAAFVGLVLPGEVAVLLGGVVASGGGASLGVMIIVASVAAAAGDSVGYEIGRRYGPVIVGWPPFERRFGSQVEQASAYLRRRGGWAVFLGRWTSILRALVPGLAGMSRMPYRRFLAFNVVGGIAWATTYVLLGYVAGASWRQVERVAGRASLLLLTLVVVGVVIRVATRWLLARTDVVRNRLDTLAATAPAQRFTARFAVPLAWVRDRVTPGASYGLGWTLSLLVTGAAGWLVGSALDALFAGRELMQIDRLTAEWIAAHTTPAAVTTAQFVVDALSPPIGAWIVALAAVGAWRWSGPAGAGKVVIAAVLAAGLAVVLAGTLPTSGDGSRFPSLSVSWLTATLVALVATIGPHHLRAAIRVTGAGAGVLVVAGLAELVAGDAALSGLVGGIGIGGLIAAGGELTARTVVGAVPQAVQPLR